MTTINVVWMPSQGAYTVRPVENDADAIAAMIGGEVATANLNNRLVLWANRSSQESETVNVGATLLAMLFAGLDPATQAITGDVILTGLPDAEGNIGSIPEDLLADLLEVVTA